LAATDELTGLAIYRKLSEILESEIKQSDRTARLFSSFAVMPPIKEEHHPSARVSSPFNVGH
jgi:hypothetical protein